MRPLLIALFAIGSMTCAGAQGFPRDVPGITVTGRATLVASTDIAYISERLTPVPGGGDDIERASAAVSTLLRSTGVSDVASAAYVGNDGTTGRLISGTIRDPVLATLLAVAHGVTDTVKRYPGTTLERSTTALGLAHCEDVERRLQSSALEDARARAGRLASSAGVKLGTPAIITPGNLPGYAFPCRHSRASLLSAEANALPDDGKVTFGLFVNVTFGIVAPA